MMTETLSSITPIAVATIAAMACAGFAVGAGYFAMSKRTAALILDHHGWAMPVALTLIRFAAVAVFLTVAAKAGAATLLAAFGGFLIARSVALRAARKAG